MDGEKSLNEGRVRAVADTGSSFILGPSNNINELFTAIGVEPGPDGLAFVSSNNFFLHKE